MCDYSLHLVASRPAKIEDKLVATKFNNSITRGFSAVGQPNVAVCLLPGTEIAFDENVECEPSFGIGILSNKRIGQRLARFRQVNMDNPVAHHDALEFPGGQVVSSHALVRWPARDGTAITCRRACRNCREDRRRAAASRDLAFDLIAQTDTR